MKIRYDCCCVSVNNFVVDKRFSISIKSFFFLLKTKPVSSLIQWKLYGIQTLKIIS